MSANQTTISSVDRYAMRLGDDALIYGQRLCEWCAAAPTLEEDLALANVALDFLGRTRMLYSYAGGITGQTEDEIACARDAASFENLLMVELPRGDFAFSMGRQYLIDVFEELFFSALIDSTDEELAGIAGKAIKEILYHKRRSAKWMRRLGLGTDESRQRLQAAIDELWGYVDEFFAMDDLEQQLLAEGVAVDRTVLRDAWQREVCELLEAVGITVPGSEWQVSGGRAGVHTEYLGHLLSEMQFLQRAYPGLSW